MTEQSARPRVVIVGGGFGGLEAARALAKAPLDVLLVDRQNHHCFQPLLYQVATAALSPADIAWPIRSILSGQPNLRVAMAMVTGIDTSARIVHADELDLPYDYLILACGVTHAYFGHDEWAKVAPGLKQLEDARDIRARFLLAFEKAEIADARPSGESFSPSLWSAAARPAWRWRARWRRWRRRLCVRIFAASIRVLSRIVLIEAGPRILPALPENLSLYAKRVLEGMGVEVMTDTKVTDCGSGGVMLGDKRIDASTIVWAAGVIASPAAEWIGAEHDRAGRIVVGPDLSVPESAGYFRDRRSCFGEGQEWQAGAGHRAGCQADGTLCRTSDCRARRRTRSDTKPFVYSHAGDLATVGRRAAVVKIGRFELTGFLGWLFWGVAHIYFLIGLRNRFVVAVTWLWSYLTFRRGARLISMPEQDVASY